MTELASVNTGLSVPGSNNRSLWQQAQCDELQSIDDIDAQIAILQVSYPTVLRNYSEREIKALRQLWYSIFKNVPVPIMQEAIQRFIINDRKGFFPSPGQIVEYVEQITAERITNERKALREANLKKIEDDRKAIEQRIFCDNCKFCEYQPHLPYINENGERFTVIDDEFFCYHDGKTAVSKTHRCEFFEPHPSGMLSIMREFFERVERQERGE